MLKKRTICGYNIIDELGRGQFSSVWLVEGGLALKKMDFNGDNFTEIDILSQKKHPNVVSLVNLIFTKKEICLLMPAGNISLDSYIKSTFKLINQEEKNFLMDNIKEGLRYLHQNYILHLDLHAGNIVLYKESGFSIPKIIDFGLSKYGIRVEKKDLNPYLSPPEVLSSLIKKEKVMVGVEFDLWSLGNVFYFIQWGDYPIYNRKITKIAKKDEAILNQIINFLDWNEENFNLLIEDPKLRTIGILKRKEFPSLNPNWTQDQLDWLKTLTDNKTIYFEALQILAPLTFDKLKAVAALDLAADFVDFSFENLEKLSKVSGFSKELILTAKMELFQTLSKPIFKPTPDMKN